MTVLWASSFLAPLATVLLMGLVGLAADRLTATARAWLTWLAPLTVLPAALLALVAPAGAVQVPWLLLGMGVELDSLGRPLLLVAALVYGAALWAVAAQRKPGAAALSALLLVCFAGNAGVLVARDTVTFYFAFTVMSFAAYGLVIHEGTGTARRAGRVYLVLTVLSESFILAGLIYVVSAGGRVLAEAPAAVAASPATGTVVVLLLVGFGVKAGLVPLHVWLPLAHPAAPAPGSAVLSGTMIKAGVVGWLRFLPLGEVALPAWGDLVIVLGLLGMFLMVPIGLVQTDPKVVLAYSSVSQMGVLALLVGAALAVPEVTGAVVAAVALYATHHGLAKGALFLGVDVWHSHGAGRARWWVLLGLAVAGAAVGGAPFTSGYLAKYLAKESVYDVTWAGLDLTVLLSLVGTGSVVLLCRYGWLLLREDHGRSEALDGLLVSWSLLVVSGTVVTWAVAGRWVPAASLPGAGAQDVWDGLWPVLLGLGLAAAAWWSWRARPQLARARVFRALPAGDMVVPEEVLARRVARAVPRLTGAAATGAGAVRDTLVRPDLLRGPASLLGRAESRVTSWQGSGLVILVVLALFLLVLGVVR